MKLFIKVLLALLFLYKVTSAQVNVVVNLPPVMPSELNQWRDNPSLVTIIFNNPGAPINNLRIGYKIRDLSKGTNIITTKDGQLPSQVFNTGANLFTGHSIFSFPNVEINSEFYNTAATTNSLPEGQYEYCLYVLDAAGTLITLTGNQCAYFQVIIPQPVTLLQPLNNTVYPKQQGISTYPLFLWTPAYTQGVPVNYRLRIVPVFQGQSYYDALNTNQPILNKDLPNNNYQYTPSDPSFDLYPTAEKFAWQIRATNQFGNPVTANDGKSDVFCFAFNNVNPPPENLAVSGEVSGCEAGNGSIAVTVTGGTAPYTYFWKKDNLPVSANTATISNLADGNYSVLVTDNAGDTASARFRVSVNYIFVNPTTDNSSCGRSNGALKLYCNGGVPFGTTTRYYNYEVRRTAPDTASWRGRVDQRSVNVVLPGLKAGNYTVTVTDSRPCSTTRNFNVSDDAAFTVSTSATKVFCPADRTGKIYFRTSIPNGKVLKYEWRGPSGYSRNVSTSRDSLTGLGPGDYSFVATDTVNGCTKSGTVAVTIEDLNSIIVEKTVTNATQGMEDGEFYIKLRRLNPSRITVTHQDGTVYSADKGFDTDSAAGIFTYNCVGLKGGRYTMFLYFGNGNTCEKRVDFTVASCDANFTITTDSLAYYTGTQRLTATINNLPRGGFTVKILRANNTVAYGPVNYSSTTTNPITKTYPVRGQLGEGSYTIYVYATGGCFASSQFTVYRNPRCEAGRWTSLNIAPVQQRTQMWCWLTCGQMVFTHFGITPRQGMQFQCDIISFYYPACAQNCGACVVGANSAANLRNMITTYSKFRWANAAQIDVDYVARALTMAEIKAEIDNNRPVITGICPSGATGRPVSEHVALLIGYADGTLTGSGNPCFMVKINDPYPYPRGQNPYLKAGGKKIADLQYEIEYDAFRTKLVWGESFYNFRRTALR
ncbi:MAG: SprB repeat-containing protein [Ignavibacteria bacterium]|nr:SprB repeat-containing protein [Ignavibacteria bacterium]